MLTNEISLAIAYSVYLEHFVRRWLNSRWHVGWLKHNLLHLSKIVLRVAVQNHLTNRHQGIVTMRPDLWEEKEERRSRGKKE